MVQPNGNNNTRTKSLVPPTDILKNLKFEPAYTRWRHLAAKWRNCRFLRDQVSVTYPILNMNSQLLSELWPSSAFSRQFFINHCKCFVDQSEKRILQSHQSKNTSKHLQRAVDHIYTCIYNCLSIEKRHISSNFREFFKFYKEENNIKKKQHNFLNKIFIYNYFNISSRYLIQKIFLFCYHYELKHRTNDTSAP